MYVCKFIWKIDLNKFNFIQGNKTEFLKSLGLEIVYDDNIVLYSFKVITPAHPNAIKNFLSILKDLIFKYLNDIGNSYTTSNLIMSIIKVLKDHVSRYEPDIIDIQEYNNEKDILNNVMYHGYVNYGNTEPDVKTSEKIVVYNGSKWMVQYTLKTYPDETYEHTIKVSDYNDMDSAVYYTEVRDSKYIKHLDVIIRELIEDLEIDLWTIEKFNQWDGLLE